MDAHAVQLFSFNLPSYNDVMEVALAKFHGRGVLLIRHQWPCRLIKKRDFSRDRYLSALITVT